MPLKLLNNHVKSSETRAICGLALCSMLLLFSAPCVFAKGATVRISIDGEGLSGPINVTESDVVGEFSIWSGPSSRWRAQGGAWNTDYSHIFVDFPGGLIDAPSKGFMRFEVEFYIADTPMEPPWKDTYKVLYAINPSASGGYFYLPTDNAFIYHGVEGNWFHSTQSWEKLIRPIVQQGLANGFAQDARP